MPRVVNAGVFVLVALLSQYNDRSVLYSDNRKSEDRVSPCLIKVKLSTYIPIEQCYFHRTVTLHALI